MKECKQNVKRTDFFASDLGIFQDRFKKGIKKEPVGSSLLVRKGRLELPRAQAHMNLNHARLPIPPHPQVLPKAAFR
jgi:hypothetical protein